LGLKLSGYALFPNPVKNKALVKIPSTRSTVVDAEVYDAAGRLVEKMKLNFDAAGTAEISTEKLSAGNYLLKLRDGSGQNISFKFVKE
jgi:hypothetical protein